MERWKVRQKLRERKKFNLLKILQIAPVHNSSKLPTNQGRVPITLQLHGDQITLWMCVQGGEEAEDGEINRWGERNRSKCAIMQRGKEGARSLIEMSGSANISLSIREAASTPGTPARRWQQEATHAPSPTTEGRRRIQTLIRNINMEATWLLNSMSWFDFFFFLKKRMKAL